MSDSMWPHRRQPTRLPHPWDSPGKNTGVGCHFLTAAYQAPPSMGFSRQEYGSGVPLPSPTPQFKVVWIFSITNDMPFSCDLIFSLNRIRMWHLIMSKSQAENTFRNHSPGPITPLINHFRWGLPSHTLSYSAMNFQTNATWFQSF